MIPEDELAAVAAALAVLCQQPEQSFPPSVSRWKLAARRPELEVEEIRALH